ncbi:MAG: four helix bundle suffix domain-containing protein [Hyphomicrobiaceae bacterium]
MGAPAPSDPEARRLPKAHEFQIAQLVYDVTVPFCDCYIEKRNRTHDRMVQAARSGVQNIAEGSQAGGTSKKFELKLTNVARASLEELRLDYQDFLRQRGLPLWCKEDPRRQDLINRRPKTVEDVAQWVQKTREQGEREATGQCSTYPEIAANAALTLLAVATVLLDRQLKAQAAAFEQEGGFTERLYRARQKWRTDRVD